jgi:hypothetical protein
VKGGDSKGRCKMRIGTGYNAQNEHLSMIDTLPSDDRKKAIDAWKNEYHETAKSDTNAR